MSIKSGTITLTSQELYLEAIFDQNKLTPVVKNSCDSLITDGTIPECQISIGDIAEFSGKWTFWQKLYRQEREYNYNFSPLYSVISSGLKLPDWICHRYNIVDYKVSPRLLLYPFGLFVIRVRVYFEFEEYTSVNEFINFERSIINELKIGHSNESIQSIFKTVNKFMFNDVPDYYIGRNMNRGIYKILYLYESNGLSELERAKIIRRETREITDKQVTETAKPYFGDYQEDRISVDSRGAILSTPLFECVSERNRRWKRIHLLNNMYIAFEFAQLEINNYKRIRDRLSTTLDKYNSRKVFRDPLSPRSMAILDSLLEFGVHLRDLRGELYSYLEPVDMKENVKPDVDQYIDRTINHQSYARALLNKIHFPLTR